LLQPGTEKLNEDTNNKGSQTSSTVFGMGDFEAGYLYIFVAPIFHQSMKQ